MLVIDAITQAEALTGQVFDRSVSLRWLSELDGQLALEFYGAREWAPYTEDDLRAELAVPFPWDGGVYVHYLEAMTYFSDGEYERCANARAVFEEKLAEFRRHVQRGKDRCGRPALPLAGGGGSGVTVAQGGGALWRYLSAYGTALRHGFSGSPEEWLASLKGEPGERGADGSVAFDSLTPAQRASLRGEPGAKGDKGDKGDRGDSGRPRLGSIALAAAWSGSGPFTQTVTVAGAAVTADSRVDLQPDAAALAALLAGGVSALFVENDGGVLTACALGAAPAAAMTLQCSVTDTE